MNLKITEFEMEKRVLDIRTNLHQKSHTNSLV